MKKDGIRAAMSERVEKETLKSMVQRGTDNERITLEPPDRIWLTPQFAEAANVIGGGIYHVNLPPEDREGCTEYTRVSAASAALVVDELRKALTQAAIEVHVGFQHPRQWADCDLAICNERKRLMSTEPPPLDPEEIERAEAFREFWAEQDRDRPFDYAHPERYATFTKRYKPLAAASPAAPAIQNPGTADTNFPLSDTLKLLVEWAQHLHDSHNCDCHGWEQRSFLIEAAQRYQNEIAQAAPAAQQEDAERYHEGFDDAARVSRVLNTVAAPTPSLPARDAELFNDMRTRIESDAMDYHYATHVADHNPKRFTDCVERSCVERRQLLDRIASTLPAAAETVGERDEQRYRDGVEELSVKNAEIERLRQDATQNFRWAYQLLLALAKRRLAEANANLSDPDEWPAGQEWHEMVGSSHSIFLRGARAEAGIPNDAFIELIRAGEYDVDDLYDATLNDKENKDD